MTPARGERGAHRKTPFLLDQNKLYFSDLIMSTLSGKLIRSSFLRIANLLANVVVSFLVMPFVIHALGDRWYGFWVFVGTVVGYYGFLDLGLTSAVQRFISQAIGRKDEEEINITLNTCLGLFIFGSIISLLITAVLYFVIPAFVDNPAETGTFQTVLLLVGLNFAISFPVRIFQGTLYAFVRYDLQAILEISKLILRTALIFVFLSRWSGIITLTLIVLFIDTLFNLLTILVTLKSIPTLRLGRAYYRRERIGSLFGYSIYSLISQIADSLRFKIDSFVITGFLGLALVTHYNIAASMIFYFRMFIASAVGMMLPVFSQYEGQNDFDQIREKYIFVSKLSTILSVLIGGSVIIYGKAFITRWMGSGYSDSYLALAILSVGIVFERIQTISVNLVYGLSKHKVYSWISISEGAANVVLSLLLVKPYGIYGVALGTTIPMLVTNLIVMPAYITRIIDLNRTLYLRTVGTALTIGAALQAAAWLAVRGSILASYPRLALLGAATSIVYLAITVFSLLDKRERRYFGIPI